MDWNVSTKNVAEMIADYYFEKGYNRYEIKDLLDSGNMTKELTSKFVSDVKKAKKFFGSDEAFDKWLFKSGNLGQTYKYLKDILGVTRTNKKYLISNLK